MGQSICEKLIDDHLIGGSSEPGHEAVVTVDVEMTHDVCGPPTIGIFKREFGSKSKPFSLEKLVIIPDHYIFTKDEKAARNVEVLRRFAEEHKLPHFYDVGTDRYEGVCHVTLPDLGHILPGLIVIGTDSHMATHGALGTLSMGVGNTTGAYVMGAGHIIINSPESIKVRYDNELPDYVMGKDVILQLIGDIGTDGADFKTLEFCGEAVKKLSVEERMSVCNMAIEAGGNGIIAPDEKVKKYILERRKEVIQSEIDEKIERYRSDPDTEYLKELSYDASKLEPVAACPHSPGNVKRVRDLDVKLDSVYIGSCTGGKTEDFFAAAFLLARGKKQVSIPLYIVPATTNVVKYMETTKFNGRTIKQIFEDAGANMDSFYEPSCAACLGGPVDTYGRINNESHARASTTNRNFPKRMGNGDVYLVSPLTAAASAITGKLTDPRELMR